MSIKKYLYFERYIFFNYINLFSLPVKLSFNRSVHMEIGEKSHTNSTTDTISINYEEDGILLVKELKKQVLSKGAWTTNMFLYQEYDRANSNYKPQKISLRRYQKKDGNYIQRSKFTISSDKQGHMIAKKIAEWYPNTVLAGDTVEESNSPE